MPIYDPNAGKKICKKKQMNNACEKFLMPNLSNIKLKNFADETEGEQIDEASPFVEIINGDKRIVVKKLHSVGY